MILVGFNFVIDFWFYVAIAQLICLVIMVYRINTLRKDLKNEKYIAGSTSDHFSRMLRRMSQDSDRISAIWKILKDQAQGKNDK